MLFMGDPPIFAASRGWDPTTGSASVVNAHLTDANNVLNPFRTLTPDGGAYLNEADTFESVPSGSFWGKEIIRSFWPSRRSWTLADRTSLRWVGEDECKIHVLSARS